MKDADDRVLYVGKAVDLKRRLNNYRVANPDRMPRRHLRMVRQVARIEFQFCANEWAALRRESKLLRALKPRFNRAGVWPGKPRFIVWRIADGRFELGVKETPEPGWRRFGPLNASAVGLRDSLARLLWLAQNPDASASELPRGWAQGHLPECVPIRCDDQLASFTACLEKYFWGTAEALSAWLVSRLATRINPFDKSVVAAGLEQLDQFSQKRKSTNSAAAQLALL